MSDNIPFEIQSEIIKRLPVKSVIQCRSVSKLWKSLIDSSKFIKSYHICKTQQHRHLFVRYWLADELKYVSIVDDDTFPNQKSTLTVPQPFSLFRHIPTVYSVKGLLCLYGWPNDVMNEKIVVLWNPSIGKAVGIPISNSLRFPNGSTFIGFGVCPDTSDPKLVRINTIGYNPTVNWEVEVFMLSTRVWKSVSNKPAFRTCDLTSNHVFVDGFIYWHAYDNIKLAGGIRSNLIISFDLKSHDFGEVCLPDRLVHTNRLVVSKVYESLGLFDNNDGGTRFCDAWIMKEGVTKSFTKMLSIKAPNSWVMRYRVLELRKNGEAIIENIDDTDSSVLEVYDPSSGRISGMGIHGFSYSFSMCSYMETLLLIDQSNSII